MVSFSPDKPLVVSEKLLAFSFTRRHSGFHFSWYLVIRATRIFVTYIFTVVILLQNSNSNISDSHAVIDDTRAAEKAGRVFQFQIYSFC